MKFPIRGVVEIPAVLHQIEGHLSIARLKRVATSSAEVPVSV